MSFNTILDIIKTNQAKSLDSEMEIEDCISYINEIDKKTEFLSALKKKRANDIDKQVEILDKRKIKLVCVQYPMRSIEPLRHLFTSPSNIISSMVLSF